jgi:hypothetical protein
MIDRIKLRKEYEKETGEHWKMFHSTAQPTVEYTKWLENRLVKTALIPDVVGQSEQLPCKHPEDRIWYNENNQMQCNECGEEI